MRSQLLHEHDGQRTFALILATGDEAMSSLLAFARQQRLAASHFRAIGAFQRATLAYFDWATKQFQKIPIDEQVEVLTLSGDIALKGQEPKVHAHVVLGKADATAVGGHLMDAIVRPTLEVVLVESPGHLRRELDEATGLALIRPPEPTA